jgi:hypothetical protein
MDVYPLALSIDLRSIISQNVWQASTVQTHTKNGNLKSPYRASSRNPVMSCLLYLMWRKGSGGLDAKHSHDRFDRRSGVSATYRGQS